MSFLLLSYLLTWWAGAVGFILANCLNMGLRILHSVLYINNYFHSSSWKPLQGLLPSPFLLLALCVSYVVTALSEVQKYTKHTDHYFAVIFYTICAKICTHQPELLYSLVSGFVLLWQRLVAKAGSCWRRGSVSSLCVCSCSSHRDSACSVCEDSALAPIHKETHLM